MATFKKLPWATDPDCTIDTGLQSACMQAMDEYLAANRLRVSGAGPATAIQKTSKEKRTPWLKTDDETAATAAAVNGVVESCMMTPASGSGGELGPPSIIPGFFSEAEVAQVLRAGAVELWYIDIYILLNALHPSPVCTQRNCYVSLFSFLTC